MPLDPTTPVIIGGGAVCNRTNEGALPAEPIALLVAAAREAAADAGTASADAVLDAVEAARSTIIVTHEHPDPAGLAMQLLGRPEVTTEMWMGGGELVGTMLADTASGIAQGAPGVTLLLTGESWWSRTAEKRGRGPTLPRFEAPEGFVPGPTLGGLIDFVGPLEEAVGLDQPIMQYPILENAIRARAGRTVDEHRAWLGRLWSGFSAVAATNPTAWDRTAHPAHEIAAPSPTNRYVGLPYTKLMVSNEQVDQGFALLVCSVAEAERLGVPRDRWVFPWLTVQGAAPSMTERPDLSASPMAAIVGRTLWSASGLGPDDVAHLDLYSCFPAAVQQQAAGYGIGLDRTLTVTGGMRFGGGPWNGYPMHAFVRLVGLLREDAGAVGLCSANGGAVTKLAATLLSSTPPADPFRMLRPDEELGALPRRRGVAPGPGEAITAAVETYTVMHDSRGVPRTGFVAVAPDGSTRAWGRVDDEATVATMANEEVLGVTARIGDDGVATID
jgi:acetyl-CoA C-acetyltransferase